jgi:hypothetical protein
MKLTLTNFFVVETGVSFCGAEECTGLFNNAFVENANIKKCQAPSEPGITTFNY